MSHEKSIGQDRYSRGRSVVLCRVKVRTILKRFLGMIEHFHNRVSVSSGNGDWSISRLTKDYRMFRGPIWRVDEDTHAIKHYPD